ncbi:hypothetical protein RhiJN_19692 [Ceratobasidium sp. AG-Ba]|nr:hypothetical protein RhiJN_04862 [Ceratobasidium sp. AG-Ba]QRV91674.1 hypothetical protein RhiJN_19692 [Ceratobasidium sp. AG-Ba]
MNLSATRSVRPTEIGARRVCASDKARLLMALIVAKRLPFDHTPLSYVLKLRDVFPISTGSVESGDLRLVNRVTDLERELALARADEAQAKLELLTYKARNPPVACENEVVAGAGGVKRPGSPPKPPKKKKKKIDGGADDRVWFEQRAAEIDAALESLQRSIDPGAYLKSAGLVASLLRLRGAPVLTVQSSVAPLLQRCLIDYSAHVKTVCADPTSPVSLDTLNGVQTLLPELLLAVRTRTSVPVVDVDSAELSRILARDLIEPILRAFHPASTALASRANGATRSRTRRGKLKSGARAAREAEEDRTIADVRPGLLNIVSIVAKSKAIHGGGMVYAVLPIACRLVRELVPPGHRPSAPGSGTAVRAAQRVRDFTTADSLWYLSSACHTALEHTVPFTKDDNHLLSQCSEILVAVLTNNGEAHSGGPMREMLCALLERIMLCFPS